VHRDGARVTDLDGAPVDVPVYRVSPGADGDAEAGGNEAMRAVGGGQW
jgi:anti-sigma factor RsiW